jgi:hypothetical protein
MSGVVEGRVAVGFQDASLWEEAKIKGDANIKWLFDEALENTSVTIVSIGYQTASHKYVNYEVTQSIKRGNGILPLRINHLLDRNERADPPGPVPAIIAQSA